MNHTILSLQAKYFLLVLKNLEELIFNMAHIVDKIVFGFSITFMVLFAIPVTLFGFHFSLYNIEPKCFTRGAMSIPKPDILISSHTYKV